MLAKVGKFGFVYSKRKASMGLSRDALRAGYQPKKIPVAAEETKAIRMDIAES